MIFKKIKEIFTYIHHRNLSQRQINLKFLEACSDNNLSKVKYWLTSPSLKIHADLNFNSSMSLSFALDNKNFELLEYLLSSTELKKHADIHARNDDIFRWACFNNDKKLIKYILSSSTLKEHIDIHSNCGKFTTDNKPISDGILLDLCYKMYISDFGFHNCDNREILKFLLTSPELPDNLKLNDSANLIFDIVFNGVSLNRKECFKFLIIECDLEKTSYIENFLLKNSDNELAQEILNLFEKRNLHNELQKELNSIPFSKMKNFKL